MSCTAVVLFVWFICLVIPLGGVRQRQYKTLDTPVHDKRKGRCQIVWQGSRLNYIFSRDGKLLYYRFEYVPLQYYCCLPLFLSLSSFFIRPSFSVSLTKRCFLRAARTRYQVFFLDCFDLLASSFYSLVLGFLLVLISSFKLRLFSCTRIVCFCCVFRFSYPIRWHFICLRAPRFDGDERRVPGCSVPQSLVCKPRYFRAPWIR